MASLQSVVKQFEGKVIKIGAKTGTSEKIFGSITNIQMAESIKKQLGIDLERKQITVPDDIRSLGSYTAKVALHKEVVIDVNFEVIEE